MELTGSLLFASNGNPLALQSTAIVLGFLTPTRQTPNMAYPSVAPNLLQPLNIHRIKSLKVTLNLVLGDSTTKTNELFFGEFFRNFVLHAQVIEDLE